MNQTTLSDVPFEVSSHSIVISNRSELLGLLAFITVCSQMMAPTHCWWRDGWAYYSFSFFLPWCN